MPGHQVSVALGIFVLHQASALPGVDIYCKLHVLSLAAVKICNNLAVSVTWSHHGKGVLKCHLHEM